MDIGKQIKELRINHGVSQEALARAIHIDRTTLAGYETNRRLPDANILCSIADFFGVSTDFLLGRKMANPRMGILSDRQLEMLKELRETELE